MARPRLPQAKAEVSGATLKDPGRFRGRKTPKSRPLGPPYARMTDGQKSAWEVFRSELPWLTAAHRQILRLACTYAARLDEGEVLGESAARTFTSLLTKLGATPADETRVAHGSGDEVDDEDGFFARPN